jgi:hypothetical protein
MGSLYGAIKGMNPRTNPAIVPTTPTKKMI